MIVFQKKTGRVTGLENAALQLWAGFFTVAAFVWIRGGVSLPDGTGEWVRIGMLGLLNTGAGCWMYFSALGRLPVQTVAVCGYAEPLAAVALSALLLHEALTAAQLVGAGAAGRRGRAVRTQSETAGRSRGYNAVFMT